MSKKARTYKFLRSAVDTIATPYAGNKILLYPYRKLSVNSYAFPFAGVSRVREALRIKYKPLLGDSANDVSLVPFSVNSEKKASSGCVFMLVANEASTLENEVIANRTDFSIWPEIVVFAAEVDGNGVVILSDEEIITTLWLKDWIPMFYKTAERGRTNPDAEIELITNFIEQQGENVPTILSVRRDDFTADEINRLGNATIKKCPAYEQLDLSSRGANLLERREKIVSYLHKAGRFAVISGLIFCLAASWFYYQGMKAADETRLDVEEIYFASFNERSRQPVGSALAKLRAVGAPTADKSVFFVLRSLTTVWERMTEEDITIDSLRYGAENTDIVGMAGNNEAIYTLRSLLNEQGFTARTDNIQTIPSGQLRFSINLTTGGAQQ